MFQTLLNKAIKQSKNGFRKNCFQSFKSLRLQIDCNNGVDNIIDAIDVIDINGIDITIYNEIICDNNFHRFINGIVLDDDIHLHLGIVHKNIEIKNGSHIFIVGVLNQKNFNIFFTINSNANNGFEIKNLYQNHKKQNKEIKYLEGINSNHITSLTKEGFNSYYRLVVDDNKYIDRGNCELCCLVSILVLINNIKTQKKKIMKQLQIFTDIRCKYYSFKSFVQKEKYGDFCKKIRNYLSEDMDVMFPILFQSQKLLINPQNFKVNIFYVTMYRFFFIHYSLFFGTV